MGVVWGKEARYTIERQKKGVTKLETIGGTGPIYADKNSGQRDRPEEERPSREVRREQRSDREDR